MDRYAVIGHPVEHSLSPTIHNLFAMQTGEILSYEKLPCAVDGFVATVTAFFASGGRGLNVTVPFKQQAAVWVDELSDAARVAGVVNTITPAANGYAGFNTDGIGLLRDLTTNLALGLAGTRVLLLGAGGAAQGIVRPLLDQRLAQLTIANRNPEKARLLVDALGREVTDTALAWSPLTQVRGSFELIINATSAGLSGTGDLIDASVARGALCYDLVYGAEKTTAFCRWALAAGATRAVDGLGMLVEQAAEAFYLWRGVRPQTAPVLAGLRAPRV